jgi:penicillin G amidase
MHALERGRARLALRYGNAFAALAAAGILLGLLGAGFATIPALGPALVPGRGVWASASGEGLPVSQTLRIAGLHRPVRVWFTSQGMASIDAKTDDDAYLALGYLEAHFRLSEMDVERRLAEGRLAQLTGPSAVRSDEFELRIGLLRTAQQEWALMPRSSPAAQALIAYSRGVNDDLAQVRASGAWPAVFSLAGVYPRDWTPVDSLAVQGLAAQESSFCTAPLGYELLERSLGAARTMDWFPILPPNPQRPYDRGPYPKLGLEPIAVPADGREAALARSQKKQGSQGQVSGATARAASAILAQARRLRLGQIYTAPASNAWAANGPRVAGRGAMLGGDPHLLLTLPSVWFEVALAAPGLAVSGVSFPGEPGILIGHNAHIAWSITDTQSQSTLFYDERTAASRPGQYFWDGRWRRMRVLRYSIPVRGHAPVRLAVDVTVHGPVLTQAGQTVSVDWMGALGSPDLAAILAVDRASDFAQFRAALANWRAPALNFVYADDRGNIGAISAGWYPQVRHGDPWLPMPGNGSDDVTGVIPYAAVPQVYDPPSHVIVTANQRPVGASYPYYIGTSADFFDPGYRAGAEYAFLLSHRSMRPSDFAALQSDVGDPLASVIVPKLIAALGRVGAGRQGRSAGAPRGTAPAPALSPLQQAAERVLRSWNRQMTAASAGASIWWVFWSDYLTAVFQPWWTSSRVPVHADQGLLSVNPDQFSLDEDVEAWTLSDQRNPAFSLPGGPTRDADGVMSAAFRSAVAQLSAKFGGAPSSWAWGRLHTRRLLSVFAAGLGYGPVAAGGDIWTVDAAEGGLSSVIGPSFRMIVHWARPGQPVAEGIYPGGLSENPASPWYENLVADWWAGRYLPMPDAGGSAAGGSAAGGSAAGGSAAGGSAVGAVRWVLRP